MNKNVQGHIFALTANILWGLMAPIGKSALIGDHIPHGGCGSLFLAVVRIL